MTEAVFIKAIPFPGMHAKRPHIDFAAQLKKKSEGNAFFCNELPAWCVGQSSLCLIGGGAVVEQSWSSTRNRKVDTRHDAADKQ